MNGWQLLAVVAAVLVATLIVILSATMFSGKDNVAFELDGTYTLNDHETGNFYLYASGNPSALSEMNFFLSIDQADSKWQVLYNDVQKASFQYAIVNDTYVVPTGCDNMPYADLDKETITSQLHDMTASAREKGLCGPEESFYVVNFNEKAWRITFDATGPKKIEGQGGYGKAVRSNFAIVSAQPSKVTDAIAQIQTDFSIDNGFTQCAAAATKTMGLPKCVDNEPWCPGQGCTTADGKWSMNADCATRIKTQCTEIVKDCEASNSYVECRGTVSSWCKVIETQINHYFATKRMLSEKKHEHARALHAEKYPECKAKNLHYLGDGYCDGDSEYNNAECGFDGGDCCAYSCSAPAFSLHHCGENGFTCQDPENHPDRKLAATHLAIFVHGLGHDISPPVNADGNQYGKIVECNQVWFDTRQNGGPNQHWGLGMMRYFGNHGPGGMNDYSVSIEYLEKYYGGKLDIKCFEWNSKIYSWTTSAVTDAFRNEINRQSYSRSNIVLFGHSMGNPIIRWTIRKLGGTAPKWVNLAGVPNGALACEALTHGSNSPYLQDAAFVNDIALAKIVDATALHFGGHNGCTGLAYSDSGHIAGGLSTSNNNALWQIKPDSSYCSHISTGKGWDCVGNFIAGIVVNVVGGHYHGRGVFCVGLAVVGWILEGDARYMLRVGPSYWAGHVANQNSQTSSGYGWMAPEGESDGCVVKAECQYAKATSQCGSYSWSQDEWYCSYYWHYECGCWWHGWNNWARSCHWCQGGCAAWWVHKTHRSEQRCFVFYHTEHVHPRIGASMGYSAYFNADLNHIDNAGHYNGVLYAIRGNLNDFVGGNYGNEGSSQSGTSDEWKNWFTWLG